MALTFTNIVVGDSIGNRRRNVVDVALDNSYATGGYVLTPQQLGMTRVDYGDVSVKTVVAAGPVNGFLDTTNPLAPKLKLNNAAAEMGAAAALTGAVIEIDATGEV